MPVSLLTCVCVCVCYNGALALWHLRYIINLKAWIISCRCTPGNQGGDDGVVDGGRGVGGTAGVFVSVCWRGWGGSWVTCCCWLALNISKYMTSTWLLYLVYIARLLDFFFFFLKLLPGNWLQSAQEREASISSIHPSSSAPLSIIIDVNYRDD